MSRNPVTQINSSCRFEHGETDPNSKIRLLLARDCREYDVNDVSDYDAAGVA